MVVDPINGALELGHKKLTELLTERSKIDKEIVEWKRVIDSLLAVSQGEDTDPSDVQVSAFLENEVGIKIIKFTDGVRMVLRQNASRTVPISVPEIRDQLINLGFDFAKYAQPLVPIHNTLKRLEDQGEVSPIKSVEGQTLGYKWISPLERALKDGWTQSMGENILALRAGIPKPISDEPKKSDAEAERQRQVILERIARLGNHDREILVERAAAVRRGRAKKEE